jgi:RHH-type rel operon transcriptional repressor/antitoxin RelB
MGEKNMAVSLRLDREIEKRLNNLFALTDRTKSDLLRELIQNGLDDLEDFYLADAIMERMRKGAKNVLHSTQARKALGLD